MSLWKQPTVTQWSMNVSDIYSIFSVGPHEEYLNRAVEMLDPDLKPVPPQPNCPQSMQIYDDHRRVSASKETSKIVIVT